MNFNDGVLKNYSDKEIDESYRALSPYSGGSIRNGISNNNDWGAIGNIINERICERTSLKRSLLSDVQLLNCAYNSCAFCGSIFKSVTFTNTQLHGDNFTFCIFQNCEINYDVPTFIDGSNFGQSEFINCIFCNVIFRASTLSQSRFINCDFINCEIQSSTLENAEYISCNFENVTMRSLNLEFAIFKNSKFKNTSFPLYQFAYIFGSVEILADKSADIFFCANGKTIKKSEFIGLLRHLIIYYAEEGSLFPTTNLYVMLNDLGCAYSYFQIGLKRAIHEKNFRMINHFCRLGKINSLIDIHEANKIIAYLDESLVLMKNEESKDERYQILLNQAAVSANQIRQLLMYDASQQFVLQFEVETTIPIKSKRKINKLQNQLQELIDIYGQDADLKFIEVRHGSPASFFIQFTVEHPEVIFEVSFALIKFIAFIVKKAIGWYKKRRSKNFIIDEIHKKYGDKVEIRGAEWRELLKKEIQILMSDMTVDLNSKTGRNNKRTVSAVTQKIINAIDTNMPVDDSFIIMTTRK